MALTQWKKAEKSTIELLNKALTKKIQISTLLMSSNIMTREKAEKDAKLSRS